MKKEYIKLKKDWCKDAKFKVEVKKEYKTFNERFDEKFKFIRADVVEDDIERFCGDDLKSFFHQELKDIIKEVEEDFEKPDIDSYEYGLKRAIQLIKKHL